MLAIFCLRLSFGMLAALLLFSPKLVNPRFYRTHFLTALGLTALALALLQATPGAWRWAAIAALTFNLFGSIVWSIEGAPGGRTLIWLGVVASGVTMGMASTARPGEAVGPETLLLLANDVTAAALLGTAVTAMLMGHSYLIAPAMSLTPLLRLLGGLIVSIGLRIGVVGIGLWSWTAHHSLVNLNDENVLWLPIRWLVGFAAPLGLGWMAWQAAKIRSTQSATGILYVVVIFCFLGELTSQLLVSNTGYHL